MQGRTIFSTPVITPALRGLSKSILKLLGWKLTGTVPPEITKCVLIGAPHSTNWDLPFGLMFGFALDLPFRWIGKKSIFKFPFGGLMRWMGGVAVDRSRSDNTVTATAEVFSRLQELRLVIAPEGTRARVQKWKSGFYHIAHQANVPIVLAYIDYTQKCGGIGKILYPSGDFTKDMESIMAFYRPYLIKAGKV